MKIKINLATRFTILSLLPEKGNMMDMLLKRQIVKLIDITSEEVNKYKIHNENEKIVWTGENGNEIPEFEFNDEQVNFLKRIFQQLNEQNNITDNILDFAVTILNED